MAVVIHRSGAARRSSRGVNASRYLVIAIACAALSACASSGAVPRPFPGAALPPAASTPPPASVPPLPPPPAAAAASAPSPVVPIALTYRGVPYRNGGGDPSGFDCSGFVQWVFAQTGIALPREVREQYRSGTTVERDAVKPGDLIFFETVTHGPSHVGIALGGDTFIHAPSSRGVVRI